MNRRTAARLAWSLWGLYAALGLGGLLLYLRHRTGTGTPPAFALGFSGFATVGALIASRRPGNAVGWLFCATGLSAAVMTFASSYAAYALIARVGPLPAAELMAWLVNWLWVPGFGTLVTFLLLLFPDGRLTSPRWRPVAWLTVGVLATMAGVFAFTPGPIDGLESIQNPLGVESLERASEVVGAVLFLLLGVVALLSGVSLVLRFRRSRGHERQQLTWFTYAAVIVAALPLGGPFLPDVVGGAAYVVAVVGLPVATGIAILKYHLYDIDRIINRTLVYGALTALLVAVYVGAVVGFGALFRSVTGQENNALVIAASTLAVAALFRPARRKIQGFIDRRFYRRKYDAARTLEAFSARLREQVDLDSLTGELVGVVQDTMQPIHVSLWLRPAGALPREKEGQH